MNYMLYPQNYNVTDLIVRLSVFRFQVLVNDLYLFVLCSAPNTTMNGSETAVEFTLESSPNVLLNRLCRNADR